MRHNPRVLRRRRLSRRALCKQQERRGAGQAGGVRPATVDGGTLAGAHTAWCCRACGRLQSWWPREQQRVGVDSHENNCSMRVQFMPYMPTLSAACCGWTLACCCCGAQATAARGDGGRRRLCPGLACAPLYPRQQTLSDDLRPVELCIQRHVPYVREGSVPGRSGGRPRRCQHFTLTHTHTSLLRIKNFTWLPPLTRAVTAVTAVCGPAASARRPLRIASRCQVKVAANIRALPVAPLLLKATIPDCQPSAHLAGYAPAKLLETDTA